MHVHKNVMKGNNRFYLIVSWPMLVDRKRDRHFSCNEGQHWNYRMNKTKKGCSCSQYLFENEKKNTALHLRFSGTN